MVKTFDSSRKVASLNPSVAKEFFGLWWLLNNFSKEFTQLCPEKMSRCLSPHPDGWDVKPEVSGDLTRQALSSLLQTLVSHKNSIKTRKGFVKKLISNAALNNGAINMVEVWASYKTRAQLK